MDPDLCIHSSLPSPLSSPLLPSLRRPLQCNPVPPHFVALLWSIKSFLKAPGLSHQQHIGQSDSLHCADSLTLLCCSLLPMFAVFLRSSVFLRICCALFLGHSCNLHHSCHTALLLPYYKVLVHSCDCSLYHSLVWEMAHALLESCSV